MLSFLFAGLLASACSVTARLPMTRLESPETGGGFMGAEAEIAYQGRSEVEFTPNYVSSPPTLVNPSVEAPVHSLLLGGSIGLLERLDLALNLLQPRAGLKLQILGRPRAKAGKGNFSVALSAGISGGSEKETFTNLITRDEVSYELKETQYDFAFLLGWRAADGLLLYGGPFLVLDDVSTTYKASAGATPAVSRGTIRSRGASLGLQFSDKAVFLRLEGAGAITSIGQARVGRGTYGVALGRFF